MLRLAALLAYLALTAVSPVDPHVTYVGRFDTRDPRGPRCAWAGSEAAAAFDGTALGVRMRDTATEDYFAVEVDGGTPTVLAVRPRQERYDLARDLPRERHFVRLIKRTEPNAGTAQILGFETDGALLAPRPRPQRRIEIIGDSISCGFGNEAANENEPYSPRTENNGLAYGASWHPSRRTHERMAAILQEAIRRQLGW